jgi:dTDP-4-amino-4,6-dideoxygalactose transaminase
MSTWMPSPDDDLPAALGGQPLFPEGLPLARPALANPEAVAQATRAILASGVITNGPTVRELEARAAEYLGVRHCVAVASCTAGLMLVLRASGLSGDVVLPSFTFSATAHAVAWNGLRPKFADIRLHDLLLDPEAAARSTGVRTSAILATHTYGAPCDVEALEELARQNGIRLFFDAAHAFGSRRGSAMIGGFGDAEVFSLSPTKLLIAGEGGIIATDDDELAERCRYGRDYGNPGDYDTRFLGLNARMSELHAATALASFEDLEERIAERNRLAERYRKVFRELPGVDFPVVADGDRSTYKDLTVLIDREAFGMDAAAVARALAAEGVQTRRYYAPPVHRQRAYRSLVPANGPLPVTDLAAARVLTLPLWTGMTDAQVDGVGRALARLAAHPAA